MLCAYSAEEYWAWLRSDTKNAKRRRVPLRQTSVDSVLNLKPSYHTECSPPGRLRLRQMTPRLHRRVSMSAPHAKVKHIAELHGVVDVGPDTFRLHQPDNEAMRTSRAGIDMRCDGDLVVRVYSGRGLGASVPAQRYMYCLLEVDSSNMTKTRRTHGTSDFEWNEEFQLELRSASELCLQLYRRDDSPLADRLCFSGVVALRQCLRYGHQQMVALKLEPKGILYIELTFIDVSTMSRRCSFDEETF